MIPRTEIEAVELRDSVNKLTQLFIETGYSKIIVFNNSLDDASTFLKFSFITFSRLSISEPLSTLKELMTESCTSLWGLSRS